MYVVKICSGESLKIAEFTTPPQDRQTKRAPAKVPNKYTNTEVRDAKPYDRLQQIVPGNSTDGRNCRAHHEEYTGGGGVGPVGNQTARTPKKGRVIRSNYIHAGGFAEEFSSRDEPKNDIPTSKYDRNCYRCRAEPTI